MADSDEKGAFQADIPVDAVQEALRSVERIASHGAPTPTAVAPSRSSAPTPAPSRARSRR